MKTRSLLSICLLTFIFACQSASAARIKDIAQIHGVRDNQLSGYGIVTGLNGTGDDMTKSVFTLQAIYNMMTRHGITIDPDNIDDIKIENIAAVMVTGTLPPFAKSGSRMDVQVSSIGDAESLAGGTLLMTPLLGPDGNIYSVAQGPITIGAFSYGGKAAQVQQNHPTVGRIAGGAIIEKSVDMEVGKDGQLQFQLRDADFTTASNLAASVNKRFGKGTAYADSPGTIQVRVTEPYKDNIVDFVAALETLDVRSDTPAKIVVNERTGTIVMGKDVRLSTVAVSHGNLSLIIRDDYNVSQPAPFGEGQTVVTPETTIDVIEDDGELVLLDLDDGVSIGEIANALNAIGATPRDLIAIFQAIKASGSLQGELVVL
ncbi:flagellar basal body P-ring protein FlgI [Desulforhopalus sp. 52FAK]